MKRVVFDLTDLVAWGGNLTGIQRVVYNFAIRIEKDFPNVAFTRYDPDLKVLFTASLGELSINVHRSLDDTDLPSGVYSRLRHLAKSHKIYGLGRKYLPLRAKKIIVYTYKKTTYNLKLIKNAPSHFRRKMQASSNTFAFKDGDVFVIAGAGWLKEGLLDFLGEEKKHTDISIQHVVYDLIPALFPQSFGSGFGNHYAIYLFKMVEVCDSFVAISESTKRDLTTFMKEMNFDLKKVDVIRLGDEINSRRKSSDNFSVPKTPFILSVGTFEVRKNYELIYQAYKLAQLDSIELPTTIIVGRLGWLTNDLKYKIENDPIICKKIILKFDANDEELNYLYQNCLFTVYPSLYEGWGLPIAESLAYGKICLSSETSSMKEIAGSILEYFNPNDPVALLKLIQKYLDSNHRAKVEKKIKENYQMTTWQQTATQFFNLLRQY